MNFFGEGPSSIASVRIRPILSAEDVGYIQFHSYDADKIRAFAKGNGQFVNAFLESIAPVRTTKPPGRFMGTYRTEIGTEENGEIDPLMYDSERVFKSKHKEDQKIMPTGIELLDECRRSAW